MTSSHLQNVDLSQSLAQDEYEQLLQDRQKAFLELRLQLGGQIGGSLGPPLLILFEGWDAGGKGGVHQAPGGTPGPASLYGSPIRRPQHPGEAAPLPVALLAGDTRSWRHVHL